MQGPEGPCASNCAGPVKAARIGPVPIWLRVLQWSHMGLTSRVSRRFNANILHDVFWWFNANLMHGFYSDLTPPFYTVLAVV